MPELLTNKNTTTYQMNLYIKRDILYESSGKPDSKNYQKNTNLLNYEITKHYIIYYVLYYIILYITYNSSWTLIYLAIIFLLILKEILVIFYM